MNSLERHAREAVVHLVATIRAGLEIEAIRNASMTEKEALRRLKRLNCATVDGWSLVSVQRKDLRFECTFSKVLAAGTGQSFPCVFPETLRDPTFDTRAVLSKKLARAERQLISSGSRSTSIVRHGKRVPLKLVGDS